MKQYRAWYSGDNPPLLFEMVYIPDDELYFRMASDHEIKYDFKVPFIDTDWIVEEGIGETDDQDQPIFHGDIILKEFWDRPYSVHRRSEKVKCEVIYEKGRFTYKRFEEGRGYGNTFGDWWHSSIVIGTIHDKERKIERNNCN